MILKLIRIWFRQFSIINLNYLLFYLINKNLKKQWCCTDFILENVCRRPVNSIIIENSYGNSGQKQVGVYCNNFSIHDQTFEFFRKREISFLSLYDSKFHEISTNTFRASPSVSCADSSWFSVRIKCQRLDFWPTTVLLPYAFYLLLILHLTKIDERDIQLLLKTELVRYRLLHCSSTNYIYSVLFL